MLDPFVVGDYVSQENFCGRSNEANVLEECIREGKNVVLHSARRLGKNRLIEHIFHKASFKEEFGCLCVDASVCGSLKEFAFVLVDGILRSVRNDHGSFEKLAGLYRRLALSMTMGQSSELVSPSFSFGSIREPER